ncbi:MAG: hypothetical protein Q7U68_01680 [Candidatus Roizmanbacteria bacterium]|nr:hypothetical protein [Candidatus Roizmanbacteria bacterium]
MNESSDYYKGKSIISPQKKSGCATFATVFIVTVLLVSCGLITTYLIIGKNLIDMLVNYVK